MPCHAPTSAVTLRTAERTRWTRAAARTGAAVAIASGAVLAGRAEPAAACTCGNMGDADSFHLADVVFRGVWHGYEPPPTAEVMSSMDPATWTFIVREVYKGTATAEQDVVSPVSGASCGLEIPHEGEFFVFANRVGDRDGGDFFGLLPHDPNRLIASLCGGTRSVVDGPLAVDGITPRPPEPAADRSSTATPEPTATPERSADQAAGGAGEPAEIGRAQRPVGALALGVAVVAALAAAAVAWRGRGAAG